MPVDFVSLFATLTGANARFVVVGGLAMVLHGFDRLTADVDLVVDLSSENAGAVIRSLVAAGYRPLAPVDPTEFASEARRNEWREQRNMQVFSMWDTANERPAVDLFVSPPIAFSELERDALPVTVGGIVVYIASLQHLLAMKRLAARPTDLADVARLEARIKSGAP
jgi:hypothetical protein